MRKKLILACQISDCEWHETDIKSMEEVKDLIFKETRELIKKIHKQYFVIEEDGKGNRKKINIPFNVTVEVSK